MSTLTVPQLALLMRQQQAALIKLLKEQTEEVKLLEKRYSDNKKDELVEIKQKRLEKKAAGPKKISAYNIYAQVSLIVTSISIKPNFKHLITHFILN